MKSKFVMLIPGVCLAGGFLWWIANKVDPGLIAAQLQSNLNLELFCYALLSYCGFFIFKAYRWRVLLASVVAQGTSPKQAEVLSTWRVLPYVMIGYAGNMVLPMQMGEAGRGVLLSRHFKLSKTSTLSGIGLEKLLDVIALLVFLEIASWFLVDEFVAIGFVQNWLSLAMIMSLILAVGAVIYVPRISNTLLANQKRVSAEWQRRLIRRVLRGVDGLTALKNQPVSVFFATFLMWGFMLLAVYFSIGIVALRTDMAAAALVMFVAAMGLILPTAPGYVGTIQMAFAVSLLPLGFNQEKVIAASVVYNFLITVPPLIAAGISVWSLWYRKGARRAKK